MFGGYSKKMYWSEYVAMFEDADDRRRLRLIRKYILKHNLDGLGGFAYQAPSKALARHTNYIDKLSGKRINGFSLRAWGDLMASLVNSKIRCRRYNYCSFAWNFEWEWRLK